MNPIVFGHKKNFGEHSHDILLNIELFTQTVTTPMYTLGRQWYDVCNVRIIKILLFQLYSIRVKSGFLCDLKLWFEY